MYETYTNTHYNVIRFIYNTHEKKKTITKFIYFSIIQFLSESSIFFMRINDASYMCVCMCMSQHL